MPSVNTKIIKGQKKIGRPLAEAQPRWRHWHMRVSDEFVALIDHWRRGQPDMPNRSEAVRRLVELGRQNGRT